MQAITSGDASKITQVLAPQISAAKTSAQQNTKTASEFGTRSGGTAAETAATADRTHSDITDMIAKLTGSSLNSEASVGSSLLSTGLSGDQAAFGDATAMQKQRAAQLDDIIKSSASVASGVMGAIPAGTGSFADLGGNFLSGLS